LFLQKINSGFFHKVKLSPREIEPEQLMEHHHHNETHSVGYGIYILIWLGLVTFTGLTIAIAGINLQEFTVPAALAIASLKTMLVILYFMHIKYESFFFKVMIAVCLITFTIFIVLTFFDILFR
jgi:cytochrome c oxidase subunit 4